MQTQYPATIRLNGYVEDVSRIKDSFYRYQQLCNDEKAVKSEKWLSLLDKTDWFFHVVTVLDTANLVLNLIKV